MAAAAPATRPRWGVLGVGGISNDFCASLVANSSAISAVGARDAQRAQAFATRFGAARAHGSYEAVVQDAEVDIVYVGTIHTMHAPHVRLALEAGKHVLCEKPFAVNEAEARELVELARSNKLFLMEAMWTRFFPSIRKVREVLASGEVGVPTYVQGDFGFVAPEDETHRLWDPQQAGGAMLDVGIYLVQAATMAFGPTVPDRIACTGQLSATGVDKEGAISLTWEGKGSASLICSLTCNTPERIVIICSKGSVEIHGPAHCSQQVTVSREIARGEFAPEVFKYELPKTPEGLTVNYPNSEGFLYQAQAVEKVLQAGLLECPEYTLDESLAIMRVMDTYRKQVGVVYPFEK